MYLCIITFYNGRNKYNKQMNGCTLLFIAYDPRCKDKGK